MNFAKIQTDVVNAIIKKGNNNGFKYGLTQIGDVKYVCIATEVMLYLIRSEDFMIDLNKWDAPAFRPDRLISEAYKAKDAQRTCEQRFVPEYKATLVKVANESEHAWVNAVNLKMFDADAQFKIINRKSPVFIYEHDELVGVVLPVNVKGDSDGTGKEL
jgi:hypothetical protein